MAFEDVARRMRERHAPYDQDLSHVPAPMPTDEISYQLALATHRDQRRNAIVGGIVLLGLGLAVTVGTEAAASANGGGTYIIAYGPMVGGIVLLLKGLLATPPRRP